jgi:NitT/TauT family transport system ATP-binding protein
MSSRIELRNVRQTFVVKGNDDRKLRDFVALDDLNLVVEPGEFVTVVGPSGCGKSTILDLVAGLSRPTGGEVLVNDEVITGPGLDRSVVFQQYTLLPWRTAQSNVEFALEAHGGLSKAERAERARDYLDLVGLTEFANRLPGELSGGMKQRVAIARSLCYEPGVLLMDEPFGALDAQTRESLQEELLEIWRRTGTTVVFITHDIEEAVFLGQRVAVMSTRPGRIIETIPIDLDKEGAADNDVRATPEFADHRHHIWSLLRQQSNTRKLKEVLDVA